MSPYILRFTVDSSVMGGTPRAAFPTHCVQRQLSGIADAQRAPLHDVSVTYPYLRAHVIK